MGLSAPGAERCHSGSTNTDTKVFIIFSIALLSGAPKPMVFKSVLLHGNISLAYLNHLSSKMIVYKHATRIPLPSEVTSRILFLLCKRRKCFRGLLDLPRLIEYILLLITKVVIFNGKGKHEFQIFKKVLGVKLSLPLVLGPRLPNSLLNSNQLGVCLSKDI